jgi:anthranilate/para-aminobenzoate synthase component II
MFEGIPEKFSVGRYHSLLLENIPAEKLLTTASTEKGLPMAIAHSALPVWGVQFHPESILSEGGVRLFENWAFKVREKAMF